MNAFILLATLKLVLAPGTAAEPSAIVPPTPTCEPVAIWWDAENLHIGDRVHAWATLGVKPVEGATFKVPLGEIEHAEHWFTGTINAQAPRYEVESFGPIGNSDVKFKVRVWPKRSGSMRCLAVAQGQTPNYFNLTKTLQAEAGKMVEAEFKERGSSSGDCWLNLDDVDGKRIVEISGTYRDPKLLFDYQFIWTKAAEKRMIVVTKNWTKGVAGEYTMRVRAKDLTSDTLGTWEKSQPMRKAYGIEEYGFDVSDLPEGFYWMHVDYLDASGNVVHTDRGRYLKPAEKMPWDGNTLGMEDTVPPPWTKPVFGEDGVFKCWNREMRLGGAGLVSSILNKGAEMLSEPIAVLKDGQPLSFDVELVKAKTSEAVYRLKAKEADITVLAQCEFDGYVRFYLRYGKGMKNLSWRSGLKRELVKCFDDGLHDSKKDILKSDTRLDRVFSLNKSRLWWSGGIKGLYSGMANMRGIHVRDLDKAVRVFADASRFYIESKLVDEEYTGDEKRTCSFYIEASPTKPKNQEFDQLPSEKIVGWTGYLCKYYEVKYPGFERPELFAEFQKRIQNGDRVFLYNGTQGVSVESPFWGWYNQEWNKHLMLSYYAHEIPFDLNSARRVTDNWAYGCPNDKSFRDWKIWGVNWMLHGVIPEAKDLYFDLASSCTCLSKHHGCSHKDDFGRPINELTFEGCREIHKRAYKLVKAKNADGLMYGHTTNVRSPADVFFDYHTMGESLAWAVSKQDSYYEILTPEIMQGLFLSHSVEQKVTAGQQFLRWRQCWAPALYRNYNPYEPKLYHASLHFCAYLKIHDIKMGYATKSDYAGTHYRVLENGISVYKKDGQFWAYYTEGEVPVTLSNPGPRQLWSYLKNPKGSVLVALNDTDEAVEQTFHVKGLSAVGKAMLDETRYDFTTGSCTVKMPARGAIFVVFEQK